MTVRRNDSAGTWRDPFLWLSVGAGAFVIGWFLINGLPK